MVRILFLLVLLAFIKNGIAQGLKIKKAKSTIVLDGVMDEPDWLEADVANNFRQFFPSDTTLAKSQSQVRMTYDDKFIYLIARMENIKKDRRYVTPSLRRDFRGEGNDGITVVLDPFSDRTNGFMFGVNPFGVQREGLIANGGSGPSDLSLIWDNKWYSSVKTYEGYWIAEMAIPFKSIRFKEGLTTWNINFYRIDSEYAERSTWSPVPQNFDIITMAFNRQLIWDEPLKNPGTNVSVIPYFLAGGTKNFVEGSPTDKNAEAGFDAKIGISSALNLDVTVNPDFSQVEVDAQVTNLDRFEIFFPEQRQFFLENADLFADFGVEGTRPFFSRRIGIARDESTGQNIQNQIYGGVRLSGKIDNNWRIGFLDMQTGEDPKINLPSTNYMVASLQRKVFARSNIGIIAINKQAFQDSIQGEFTFNPAKYNRLLGIDYNLASKNNVWNGKFFYHHSFDQQKLDSAFATGGFITYSTLKWTINLFTRSVGANYNPEVGFARRRDIQQVAYTQWYNFYPKGSIIQSHGPGIDFDILRNQTYGLLDWDANLMYRFRFRNTANGNIRLRKEYTYLFSPFDPSGTNGQKLAAGTAYHQYLVVANFNSDARRAVFTNLSSRIGEYFNGTRINLSGSLTYRYIPWGFASLNFTINRIRLPEPYNDANLLLIGPRFDLTLSRSVFFTTFVQYNNQINNLNINSRLQWRFKPVSDIFLVYTDNYVTEAFTDTEGRFFAQGQPRLRGVVLKLNYWLNI
ncbi:MAG: carbohydrate binding family 9 domain-containing protein [Cyclobacteriaceae bacterium]|nr:carbohydrate binding family 9 domain-containing protein [Cyclobacteriaceae bacterium]UYN85924.1 MAG: carbohydrate binding family 9 domain-containing protein [Cyclobacteriaceae bacterium]